jgi:alanyl-tRNA synthetase
MGLERLSAVLSGVRSNFETDLFRPLLDEIASLAGTAYVYGREVKPEDPAFQTNVSLRVIADHARAVTFLIGDGVRPENLGRGYVLRRILRRAVRHGRKLGLDRPFLADVAGAVINSLGEAFPELKDNSAYIAKTISMEEERFGETLGAGLGLLNEAIEDIRKKKGRVLSGLLAFKLYDTYGFPVDLVADVARENGLAVDEEAFNAAMEEQKAKGRAAWKAGALRNDEMMAALNALTARGLTQEFVGHDALTVSGRRPVLLFLGDEPAERADEGQEVVLVFSSTPFYASSGGQTGDGGRISFPGGLVQVSEVVKAPGSGLFLHQGQVIMGTVRASEEAVLSVDPDRRAATAANHTATHLLHKALRLTLGEHVRQAGSMVADDRLRFDFTHDQAVSPAELEKIELLVNLDVAADFPVETTLMKMDEAVRSGAVALFEERYGEEVRVVSMGSSRELCGGTHASSTGRLGAFVVLSETAVSAGVRRLEALTGRKAVEEWQSQRRRLHQLSQLLKAQPADLVERIQKMMARNKELEKGPARPARTMDLSDLALKAERTAELSFLAAQVEAEDPKALREMGDALRDKLGPKSLLVLTAESADDKALLLVMVGKDLLGSRHAGKLAGELAPALGGRGGGKAELAQAGGPDKTGLPKALVLARELVLGRRPEDADPKS